MLPINKYLLFCLANRKRNKKHYAPNPIGLNVDEHWRPTNYALREEAFTYRNERYEE